MIIGTTVVVVVHPIGSYHISTFQILQGNSGADEKVLQNFFPELIYSETLKEFVKLIFASESGKETSEKKISDREVQWPDGSWLKLADKTGFGFQSFISCDITCGSSS